MKQSWQVFKRDVNRLIRVRKAWVIVIGVLVTPALYAWFNINAFWEPYANTANIKVAVANLDSGANSDLTGKVNIGDQVVDQLRDNDQLGWQFLDEDEAHEAVESGEVYAAIVIPKNFSKDLLSLTTGTFTQPALEYFVNEKTSAIAPKITDVGASQLDKQITEAFKEQVAFAATTAVKDSGDSVELRLFNAKTDMINTFDQAVKSLGSARTSVSEASAGLADSRGTIASARATLGDVNHALDDVKISIDAATQTLNETQQQLANFTDAASNAYLKGTTILAESAAQAQVNITALTQELKQANARIGASINEVQKVIDANNDSIAELRSLIDGGTLDPATQANLQSIIDQLEAQNQAHQQVLTQLQQLNDSTAQAVQSVQDTVDALAQAMKDSNASAVKLRGVITQTIPKINSAVSKLSASAGGFSAALTAQQETLKQADNLLAGIDTQLINMGDALSAFDKNLAGMITGVSTAKSDVLALSAASEWGALVTITGLDPDHIAKFVASPVTVEEKVVFPVASYGSAMAALFTNLSLWIGAFVLMVIFKIEVDTEGLRGITVRQAYFGRFMLLGTLAALQALIVCIGNLIIGVQTESALAFVGTGVFTAIVYLSIIYALSVSFGHIGRGLCILLVIMQIPGASGLYPIELMPGFFRTIYPLLPFSYGIDAMRETIAGFYGGHYWKFIGVLTLMMVLAFVLGLVLRRRLANFNLLFNRQIASTDLLIGEKVQVVGTGYRLSDVIHALQNRDEYRDDLARRAKPFTQHYPALLKGTLLIGAIGMVTLGVIAWLLPGGKALMLGLWVVWCLLVMGFLVVLEYIKQSFAQAQEVAQMQDDDLREAMFADGGLQHELVSVLATPHEATANDEPSAILPGEPSESSSASRPETTKGGDQA